jgi:membrane protein
MGDRAAGRSPSIAGRLARWPRDTLRDLLRVVPQAVDGFFADRCTQNAAAISYRALFSLAPLAIVLVSVFGLVLQNDELRSQVIDEIVDALPLSDKGAQQVEDAVTTLASPTTALGLLSLLVFAWAATGMMASIRLGLEAAMRVERGRPAVRSKLVDFVLIVGTGALVLLTIGLTMVTQIVSETASSVLELVGLDGSLLDGLFRHLSPILLSVVVVLLLYRFVPARRLRFGDALAGAIVTALLLYAVSLASASIFERTTRLSIIYGSLTTALVFLYSVYLYAVALLFGAEIAAAWSRPVVGPSLPIGQQVKRAVLGLFVHQEPPPARPASPHAERDDPAVDQPAGERRHRQQLDAVRVAEEPLQVDEGARAHRAEPLEPVEIADREPRPQ